MTITKKRFGKSVFEQLLKEKVREKKIFKECPTCGSETLATNKVCDGCFELYTERKFLLDQDDVEWMEHFIL